MSALDWPQPAPASLSKLAPTTANALLACEKRVAFQLDTAHSHLSRPNTRTALGSAAHGLIELVARGNAPPVGSRQDWLERRWAELLDIEVRKLESAWHDRTVPPVDRWPGLVATRRRLVRRLATFEVTGTGPRTTLATKGTGGKPPLPWVERWMEDPTTGLAGKPDVVEMVDGRVRIVDHKTGVHQDGIGETQRRQLLLYAHLASRDLGLPVDEAVILDAKGHAESFAVDPAQVVATVEEVIAARDRFETTRTRGAFVASPSPDGCRRCPFRTVCIDYWIAREESSAALTWSTSDLRGEISPHELSSVVGIGSAGARVQLVLADGVTLGDATEIVATDLDRNGVGGARMRWNSLIRTDSGDSSTT